MSIRVPRFTSKDLMLVVAFVAATLYLYREIELGGFAFLLGGLALTAWFAARRRRRFAGYGIAISALVSTTLGSAFFIYPWMVPFWFLIVALFGSPLCVGFGVAWADSNSNRAPREFGSMIGSWLLATLSVIVPVTMFFTDWPLRLAFLISSPALNQLADRVAAGYEVVEPEHAGLYRIVASERQPESGSVALIVAEDFTGDTGFMRLGANWMNSNLPPLLLNPFFDVRLNRRWVFMVED
jgi:hypothetical protein